MKRFVKHLFAPAIVVLLVAIMGVFSPVVSVAAALRVNAMADPDKILDQGKITNLPARNVKVGESITAPTFTAIGGLIELCHAGKVVEITGGSPYTYNEVGQYEWRFSVNNVLINKHMVNVTDTSYSMTMPDNVVTVAPKDLETLKLPLPSTYKVNGEAINVDTIEKGNDAAILNGKYVKITADDEANTVYTLTAVVTLENRTIEEVTIDENGLQITMPEQTGNLKVAYQLYNADGSKLLVVMALNNIEIKNVKQSEVTFANIPSAPSVKNLAYYSSVALTAPTADSAKFETTSFNVEAQTKIFQVQCSPYSTEPSDWNKKSDQIHNLTVKQQDGEWIVEENGVATDAYLEVNGLNVKIKKLGWYRFQFETSTLFGYQLDETVETEDLNIQQDDAKSYVRYWSDSIHISSDQTAPSFAWVDRYDANDETAINDMNENYSDLIGQFKYVLPMTDKADAKKVTVNKDQGLVLPAIFPHDNANAFKDLSVSSVIVKQIQDKNGDSVSNNTVISGVNNNDSSFVYNMGEELKIQFANDAASRTSSNNTPVLLNKDGLYQISITVKESNATYADGKVGGYARSKTQNYYFYLDEDFDCEIGDQNSPVIDADKKFQVSDVYLWEGNTFEFKKPNFSDAHTATDKIQVDYYLVGGNAGAANVVMSKLDATANILSVNVDLENLYKYNEETNENTDAKWTELEFDNYDTFYIYAVARNFTAMQTNLKNKLKIAINTGDSIFDTSLLLGAHDDEAELAQYGYAWKRAEFQIHKATSTNEATFVTTFGGSNTYKTGKPVHIESVKATWGSAVDGQMGVAVYQVKDNNVLIPVNVVNSDKTTSAEVVSAVSFFRNTYTMKDLYFRPGASGEYILVVTAKDYASAQISTSVTKIQIGTNDQWTASPISVNTKATGSATIDANLVAGETLVLPSFKVGPNQEYIAKNREFVDEDGIKKGDYTITVLGVNDPNCITGNKFTPNKAGQYVLRHSYYLTGDADVKFQQDYIIQVTENEGLSSIRMGEAYNDEKVLWNVTPDASYADNKHKIGDQYYVVGENGTGTNKKPAYAITLEQFVMTNYGYSTDFVVDSVALFDYLEPIYEDNKITGYMYPAIAIPMANLISDNYSSDEVEITVQKSGNSNYLVSSKKKNAGGSTDKASVIDSINGYFVFRPEGKFTANCKKDYNPHNYLEATNSPSGAAGVYTVSYKTHNTELNFNVTFGNLQNGTLSWNENFLTFNNDDGKGDQEINSENSKDVVIEEVDGHRYVTIDMSKLYFTGNADMQALIAKGPNEDDQQYADELLETAYFWENARVTVTFEGGAFIDSSDWSDDEEKTEAIKINENGKFMYKFDLSRGSGTYKVNVSLPNKYTATSVTASMEFTIDVDVTNRNHNLNNVWGIILIVLSVGLLAGVIYYFVKTSRATRFVDAPRAMKKDKKVKAPKKEEAPKKDVK